MAGVNRVTLLGYVGKDPLVSESKNGMCLANFSLATSQKRKDSRSGAYEDVTQWHWIHCFDKVAEIVSMFVKKGDRLYIEGQIEYSEYKDKNGEEKKVTKIICNQIQMLTAKGERDAQPPSSSDYKKAKAGNDAPQQNFDDDVPF